MDGHASDAFEDFESLLSPDRLAALQEQFRSLGHTDVLRADLEFTFAAAIAQKTDPNVALFLRDYTERACARAAKLDETIVQDQVTLRTHMLDPKHIERDFQQYLAEEKEFRRYVADAANDFARVTDYTDETDQRLRELGRFYDKIGQGIDREINPMVRQNVFDVGRQKIAHLREKYNPDDPLNRKDGITLQHGDLLPGSLERLVWPEEGSGGEDRVYYKRNRRGLMRFLKDIMNVRLRESVTYHPTELMHAEGVTTHVEDYEAKRALLRATTVEGMQAAGRVLVARKQKIFNPAFSLIKLNAQGQIENFTPVDETENSRSALTLRMDAMEDIYPTFWRFMKGAWGKLVKSKILLALTFDYLLSLWGNVDIDGNYIKKSDEHGLAEGVSNARIAIGRYALRLQEAATAGLTVETNDGGTPWLERLAQAEHALGELHRNFLEKQRGNDLVLSNEEFAEALDRLEVILQKLGHGKTPEDSLAGFIKDLEKTYSQAVSKKPEVAEKFLIVSKLAHHFGWHGMILEYRQTAEKHAEIIHHFLQIPIPGEEIYDYLGPKISADLSPEERERETEKRYQRRKTYLNRKLLEDPNFLRRRVEEFRKNAPDAEKLRNTRNPEDIAFHTDRTFQFFARFPHLAKRAMLAEYESAAHYMEMMAIQNACTDSKTGRSACLHIAPLFEKISILKKFRTFYAEFVMTPAILKHLFKKGWIQTIMAAYSDNMKRFGITTRMAIDGMWHDFPGFAVKFCTENREQINAALKEAGLRVRNIVLQILPDHGKSLLRPDHDGQRMLTAQMKEHCAHFVRFLKGLVHIDFTAQNRDNTVKNKEDFHRHLTRLLSEGSQIAALHREGRERRRHRASEKLTDMVSRALENLQADYDRDYSSDTSPHGHALADTIVNNEAESSDGNGSSRGALRTGGEQERNFYARGPNQDRTRHVLQEAMRAITLANDQTHMGSRNSFLGIYRLIDELNAGFRDNPDLKAELRGFVDRRIDYEAPAFDKKGNITVAGLQILSSPGVLPSLDKTSDEIGFGTNTSDLAGYADRQTKAIAAGKPMTAMVRQDLRNRIRDFFVGTEVALKCAGIDPAHYEPKTDIGKLLESEDFLENEELFTHVDRRRYLVRRLVMPLSAGELELSRLMAEFAIRVRDNILIRTYLEGDDEKGDRPRTSIEREILRLMANVRSCFIQPNALTVNDYLYAARRVEALVDEKLNAEENARMPIRHVILNPANTNYLLAA